MTRLSVADARVLLQERAEDELAEERLDPPAWAPFTAWHEVREISAARTAAATRVAHARRLIALPDRVLERLLADGWDPRRYADNARYDISPGQAGACSPVRKSSTSSEASR